MRFFTSKEQFCLFLASTAQKIMSVIHGVVNFQFADLLDDDIEMAFD